VSVTRIKRKILAKQTGNRIRYKGVYRLYKYGEPVSETTYNLLDAFGLYPEITIDKLERMTTPHIKARAEAMIEMIADRCNEFNIINNVIEHSAECAEEEDDTMIGQIIDFAGMDGKWDETKWIECDGSIFDTSDPDYSQLYDAIGREWTPDSVPEGQFAIPDYRGRVAVGYNKNSPVIPRDINGASNYSTANYGRVGNVGGALNVTLSDAQMPRHTHTIVRCSPDSGSNDRNYISGTRSGANAKTDTTPIGYEGNSFAHENRQPYAIVRKLIRYK
jgi:microcystin-dependent protein